MKLSIVIPVYQVAATLSRCVESVLAQSFSDYEMILIDDGSTDGSSKICDDYAETDHRVKVIHQQNAGLSAARNAGLRVAKGAYITFIDSDDFIGENTLSILMTRLEAHPDYDILEYPVFWHYGMDEQRLIKFGVKTYDNMRAYWLECKAYQHAYAWNKIYVRRLFEHVRFPDGQLFEDVYTLPLLLKQAKLIATTEEGVYYYTSNPDGITHHPGNGITSLLDTHIRQLQDLGLTEELSEYYAHVLNIQLDVYNVTRAEPILPVPHISSKSMRLLQLPWKSRVKLRLLKIIGMKNLCRLNRLVHSS